MYKTQLKHSGMGVSKYKLPALNFCRTYSLTFRPPSFSLLPREKRVENDTFLLFPSLRPARWLLDCCAATFLAFLAALSRCRRFFLGSSFHNPPLGIFSVDNSTWEERANPAHFLHGQPEFRACAVNGYKTRRYR